MPSPRGTTDLLPPADLPLDRWEGCTAAELRREWRLPEVHIYSSVGSTNDIARALASTGTPSGTLVLAESQRAGRGRAGRSWASQSGLGLWFSLVLRPELDTDPGTLPLRIAAAIAPALDPWLDGERVRIKWPNDLVLGNRKLGGILCEATWDGARLAHVIVGVGLNLLQGPDDFPPELHETAGSLRMSATRPISRHEVAGATLHAISESLLPGASIESALAEFTLRDMLAGRRVEVAEPETGRLILTGHAAGISPEGYLRVEAGGHVREIRSGSVRIVGDSP